MQEDPIPKPPKELKINPEFDPEALISKTPLAAAQLTKSYGGHCVLNSVDFALGPTSRVLLIGPNGAGKSTLLKILAGREQSDSGAVTLAASVTVGHLDQEQETLDVRGTLFDAYRGDRVGDWEELKAELLGYGLFAYEDLLKPAAALSVGQKRKLQIARLIAQCANLLLLDEPTNHVSLDVLEQFETALLEFPGPVLAISHDRRFIERFCADASRADVWEMREGNLRRVTERVWAA
ncbi:MAG: ATP-binding cassette domain-containing protein [Caldilineaceae bacterium]